MTCPCGSGRALVNCCGPFLDGEPAPTPEALMRSRFSAFVTGNEDHIFRTWHPRTRPPGPYVDPSVRWLGLEVVDASGDDVEFIASYEGGAVHERSHFERRAGRWFYVDGELVGD